MGKGQGWQGQGLPSQKEKGSCLVQDWAAQKEFG